MQNGEHRLNDALYMETKKILKETIILMIKAYGNSPMNNTALNKWSVPYQDGADRLPVNGTITAEFSTSAMDSLESGS